ncbi:MAG: endonuclease/exonuclease/phosphatase family protein [Verrucomicrobia bacterium]|nr:endonuclease/exonuclease/phosphatase family protein [Verrucomicrobiota bacterium]
MYVNSVQKLFVYLGYYGNGCARQAVRSIEQLTRPTVAGEFCTKFFSTCTALLSIPIAGVLFVPSAACYALGALAGRGRFEQIGPEDQILFWPELPIKIMSLNACFQDPWSPLTGGVVPPFDPALGAAHRIDAIVERIVRESPTFFLGQEFDSIGAQDRCIALLQREGYQYFLRDLGANDPIRNGSGLFIASKVPLRDVQFTAYPAEDREGFAKWANQGALSFKIGNLRIVNVHLNYGEENQAARIRQLTCYVLPQLSQGPGVVFGDLNFDTTRLGLNGLVNALENRVTCTDEGKHLLRGKSRVGCTECEEKIDGLIYDPEQVEIAELHLTEMGELSDHYATVARVRIRC